MEVQITSKDKYCEHIKNCDKCSLTIQLLEEQLARKQKQIELTLDLIDEVWHEFCHETKEHLNEELTGAGL